MTAVNFSSIRYGSCIEKVETKMSHQSKRATWIWCKTLQNFNLIFHTSNRGVIMSEIPISFICITVAISLFYFCHLLMYSQVNTHSHSQYVFAEARVSSNLPSGLLQCLCSSFQFCELCFVWPYVSVFEPVLSFRHLWLAAISFEVNPHPPPRLSAFKFSCLCGFMLSYSLSYLSLYFTVNFNVLSCHLLHVHVLVTINKNLTGLSNFSKQHFFIYIFSSFVFEYTYSRLIQSLSSLFWMSVFFV